MSTYSPSAIRAIEAICIVTYVSVQFIILPLDIYWFIKFWKHRSSLIILKRKPRMLLVQLLSLWIGAFIFQTISIPSYFNNGKHYAYIGYIQSICCTPFLITNFAMSGSRYWLLFYMIKWNSAMKNNQWQSIINPKNECTDWYLKNRKKYGSWKWLRLRIISIGFICYICIIIAYILQEEIGISNFNISIWFIYLLCGLIAIIFTLLIPGYLYYFIYTNIPKIDDAIGLQKELKPTLLFFYIFVLMSYITIAIYYFFHSKRSMLLTFKIIYPLCFVIIRIIFTCCNWRHTQWVINRFNILLIAKQFTDKEMHSIIHQKTFIKLNDDISSTNVYGDASIRTQMRDILMEDKMFHGFMRQLLSEYCSECLLSMIEMIQFKQKIHKEKFAIKKNNHSIANTNTQSRLSVQMNQNHNEERDSDQFLILPENCPKSMIVNDGNNYKQIAIQLYKKYIRIGCTLEINIDYVARNNYRNLLENEQNWNTNIVYDDPKKLYYLFNSCIEHMTTLICASFTRFRQSKEYRMVKKYAPPKNNGMFQGIISQAASLFDDDEEYIE